jgi:hypothetical protein
MAQGEGPEFKLQYHQKKKKPKQTNKKNHQKPKQNKKTKPFTKKGWWSGSRYKPQYPKKKKILKEKGRKEYGQLLPFGYSIANSVIC